MFCLEREDQFHTPSFLHPNLIHFIYFRHYRHRRNATYQRNEKKRKREEKSDWDHPHTYCVWASRYYYQCRTHSQRTGAFIEDRRLSSGAVVVDHRARRKVIIYVSYVLWQCCDMARRKSCPFLSWIIKIMHCISIVLIWMDRRFLLLSRLK